MSKQRIFQANFSKLPVNICVITFSSDHSTERDHYPMITRCLDSILENTDPENYRLHIGCNNLSPRAMEFIDKMVTEHGAVKYIGDAMQDRDGNMVYPKYPLMRRIYQATGGRQSTREAADWVVWFDDDSYVTSNDWLEKLQDKINATPRVHQLGRLRAILLSKNDRQWLRKFPWFNREIGIPRATFENGKTGRAYNFIEGGFYALSRHAINTCSLPDERLFHNRGDWSTGLALLHKGLGVGDFTYGVEIDAEPRRGMHCDRQVKADDPAMAEKKWIIDL